MALGPVSLLLDVGLAAVVVGLTLDRWRGMHVGAMLTSIVNALGRLRTQNARTLRAVAALAAVPLIAGLLSAAIVGVKHTNRASLCEALGDYETATVQGAGLWDNSWFDALEELGHQAADYAGPQEVAIRAAGKSALQIVDGDGGMIVSASTAEADYAIAPIRNLCYAD